MFVFDSEDRRVELGEVAAGDFREFRVDGGLITEGAVQVKAYPVIPGGGLASRSEGDNGVKSSRLTLFEGDVVDFWLEPNLTQSMVRLTRA